VNDTGLIIILFALGALVALPVLGAPYSVLARRLTKDLEAIPDATNSPIEDDTDSTLHSGMKPSSIFPSLEG
jgi:hypothetical protein